MDEEFSTRTNSPLAQAEHWATVAVSLSFLKAPGVKVQVLLTGSLQHRSPKGCLRLRLRWLPHLQAKSSFLGLSGRFSRTPLSMLQNNKPCPLEFFVKRLSLSLTSRWSRGLGPFCICSWIWYFKNDLILYSFFGHGRVKLEGSRGTVFQSSGRGHVTKEEGTTVTCHLCDVNLESN